MEKSAGSTTPRDSAGARPVADSMLYRDSNINIGQSSDQRQAGGHEAESLGAQAAGAGAWGGASPSGAWLVLRSIDETEAESLIEEGDRLDFSDAWALDDGDNDDVPARLPQAQHPHPRAGVALRTASPNSHKPEVVVEAPPKRAVSPQRLPCGEHAVASRVSSADACVSVNADHCRDHPGHSGCCDMAAVLGQAVVPVLKMCEAIGVELTLCSPDVINHVNRALQRRDAGGSDGHTAARSVVLDASARLDEHARRDCFIATASDDSYTLARVGAESAGRALSHVLDASMQRIGQRGKVRVGMCLRAAAADGKTGNVVEVMVSDTGIAAAAELQPWMRGRRDRGSGSGGAVHARAAMRSAEEAMHRMKAGLPVGNGSMSLRIAERFIAEEGGVLSVDVGGDLDVEHTHGSLESGADQWVHTTVSFPGA
jgi:hypothetical protein